MSESLLDIAEKALLGARAVLEAGIGANDAAQVLQGVRSVTAGLELVRELRAEAGVAADGSLSQSFDEMLAEIEAAMPVEVDHWAVARSKLQSLADNGPAKACWKDPAEHEKAMRVLLVAGEALAVWGNPATIVPGIASKAPTSPVEPNPVEDAVVVPERPAPKPRALQRFSGLPGPVSVTRSAGSDCPGTYAR